jgi:hypothetical protein
MDISVKTMRTDRNRNILVMINRSKPLRTATIIIVVKQLVVHFFFFFTEQKKSECVYGVAFIVRCTPNPSIVIPRSPNA